MTDLLLQDLLFAGRALRQRPGFTFIVVLTLALGIGASTAIFSVVNGVLLRPLPYRDADRIGILWHEFGDGAQNMPLVSPLDVREYSDRASVIEAFTMARNYEWILADPDTPELVDVALVEAGFFEFFGAAASHGRIFTPEEDVPGAAPLVLLSHRLWTRRYGADEGVLGNTIDLNGQRMEVIGVLPDAFRLQLPVESFLRDPDLWVSMRWDPATSRPRNVTLYSAFARLRPEATFGQAQQEIEGIAEQLRREFPVHAATKLRARVVPLLEDVVKSAQGALVLLFAAAGFVLLIACANVANLLIMRGRARAHEFSLRAALGASRGALIRLALAESAVLCVAGAVVGGGIARVSIGLMKALAPGSVPRLESVSLDGTVLLFTAAITVTAAALFGLVPALLIARNDPAESLGGESRTTDGRGAQRSRNALIICEIAASLTLLIGAGLMVRSFAALTAVQPGYATEGALTLRVSLPAESFPDAATWAAMADELFEKVAALPAVQGVTFVSQLPLTGGSAMQPIAYDEQTATNWESASADRRLVRPGFFDVMGARLVAGRSFTRADAEAGNVIVIDEFLAELAFPGTDAVGRTLQTRDNATPEPERYAQVIGVVSHMRVHDLSRPLKNQIYWPRAGLRRFNLVVRTSADPAALVAPVRAELARLTPGAPVEDIQTLRELFDRALGASRLSLALMSVFGLVALLLASIGIYGVLSYAVAQRTREIGIRIALGQAPAAVRRQVLLEGGRLVGIASLIGVAGGLALSRLAAGLLYGVGPLDALTHVLATGMLVAAAAAAYWVPARQATRIDPLEALRAE